MGTWQDRSLPWLPARRPGVRTYAAGVTISGGLSKNEWSLRWHVVLSQHLPRFLDVVVYTFRYRTLSSMIRRMHLSTRCLVMSVEGCYREEVWRHRLQQQVPATVASRRSKSSNLTTLHFSASPPVTVPSHCGVVVKSVTKSINRRRSPIPVLTRLNVEQLYSCGERRHRYAQPPTMCDLSVNQSITYFARYMNKWTDCPKIYTAAGCKAIQESLALASMARDDSPASSTAAAAARRPQCAVKWDRNLKPKLAIMRQCISVTDRRTDGLASWHKREMYILHIALKTLTTVLTYTRTTYTDKITNQYA